MREVHTILDDYQLFLTIAEKLCKILDIDFQSKSFRVLEEKCESCGRRTSKLSNKCLYCGTIKKVTQNI